MQIERNGLSPQFVEMDDFVSYVECQQEKAT
jgi:hypothetical protein